jgi:hypothetical protein
MAEMRITNRKELDAINKRIHDRWFNVEDVTFDANNHTLRMPFTKSRSPTKQSGTSPAGQGYLEIANVEGYTLKETQNVGRYDFNELKFSDAVHKVTITTGIPLRFEVIVRDLDIRVGDSNRETSR